MITVQSPSIEEGGIIPVEYTCDGSDISPEIRWSNFPAAAKSFVVIMDDPDAPLGTFTHWVVYDIPADINYLPENFPKVPEIEGIKQGINDFGRVGYGGPCPPLGKPHRYFFKVFALGEPALGLPPGASRQEVEMIMTGKILDEGYLMGLYGR
ncbi:YbhB/YbcL family Raf kinase inhibitor-like protein [Persephonella sp.]